MEVLSAPISSGSTVADIVRRIENAIMTGELVPGARLSEQGIARQLGVSRGALREALRQLEGRKLVERIANVGARITILTEEELVEIFEVWGALAALSSRLATPRASRKDLEDLKKLLSRYEIERGNRQRNFETYGEFHRQIVAITGNRRLIATCDEIFDVLRLYRFKLMSSPGFFERTQQVVDEQTNVIAAMAAHDASAAESAMQRHMAENLRYHVDAVGKEAAEHIISAA